MRSCLKSCFTRLKPVLSWNPLGFTVPSYASVHDSAFTTLLGCLRSNGHIVGFTIFIPIMDYLMMELHNPAGQGTK